MGIGNIILLISEDGHGKTRNLCSFPEEICLLDVDGKAQKILDAFYKDKLIDRNDCLSFHKKSDVSKGILRGNLDVDETLIKIYSQISLILDCMEDYETIAVDGVSDLKRIVGQHWLLHDPKHRKAIGDNINARAEINNIVKEKMLFPLINTARTLDKTLILTSKMVDSYLQLEGDDGKLHSVKTGTKIPDASDWIGYRMDIKVTLTRDPVGQYWMYWNRAPADNLPVRENITDKSLFEVMKMRGVL
jgi:hypothetical protein